MLKSMNALMPTPGTGTSSSSPQEVLLLITDGVSDENIGGSRTNREFNATDLASCTAIKNRGIKIAILYTDYLKVPANSWYMGHIDSFQSQIGVDLQACATPGLFIDEANDTQIGKDLANLFSLAATPGHLTQ